MMNTQEFFNKYNGCKVKASEDFIKTNSNFACWVGKIIPPSSDAVIYTEPL